MSDERRTEGPGARFGRLAGKAVKSGRRKARELQERDRREMAEEAKDAASRAARRAAELVRDHEEELRTAARIGGQAMTSRSRVGVARMAATEVAKEIERRKKPPGGESDQAAGGEDDPPERR